MQNENTDNGGSAKDSEEDLGNDNTDDGGERQASKRHRGDTSAGGADANSNDVGGGEDTPYESMYPEEDEVTMVKFICKPGYPAGSHEAVGPDGVYRSLYG